MLIDCKVKLLKNGTKSKSPHPARNYTTLQTPAMAINSLGADRWKKESTVEKNII